MKIQLFANSVVALACMFVFAGSISAQMLTPIQPTETARPPAQPATIQQPSHDLADQQKLPVPEPIRQKTPATPAAHVKPVGNTGPAMTAEMTKIGFRMATWKTVHGDGTDATKQFVETLEKIGCEVKQNNHGNHIDVVFRCPNWTAFSMQNQAQTQQWQTWLLDNGFEMMIQSPSADTQLPTVKLRLQDWKSMHLHDAAQIESMRRTFEMLGCEVSMVAHGDHTDANIRCQEWITIGLPTPKAAHVWQNWLNQTGFETQHEHIHAAHSAKAGSAQPAAGDSSHR